MCIFAVRGKLVLPRTAASIALLLSFAFITVSFGVILTAPLGPLQPDNHFNLILEALNVGTSAWR